MKAYMYANMKAKHTNIQKSYVFAAPMYIFSENGSLSFHFFILQQPIFQGNIFCKHYKAHAHTSWVTENIMIREWSINCMYDVNLDVAIVYFLFTLDRHFSAGVLKAQPNLIGVKISQRI